MTKTKTTRKQLEKAYEAARVAFRAAEDAWLGDRKARGLKDEQSMELYRASIVASGVMADASKAIGEFEAAKLVPARRNEFGEWTRSRSR